MDASVITAIFTGIGILLGLIFKQQLAIRKLKLPNEPTNLENERKICDEKISLLNIENECLREILENEIDSPAFIVNENGKFIWANFLFADLIVHPLEINQDDLIWSSGELIMDVIALSVFSRGLSRVHGGPITEEIIFKENKKYKVLMSATNQAIICRILPD